MDTDKLGFLSLVPLLSPEKDSHLCSCVSGLDCPPEAARGLEKAM